MQKPQQPNPLELLAIVSKPEPCQEGTMCKHSSFHSLKPKCNDCRLSPRFASNEVLFIPKAHHWLSVNPKWKHNVLEKEKRNAKHQKTTARQEARKAKDPSRQARARTAERAERKTNNEIIRATRNSGRVNRDGDHLLFDSCVLDTKLQSGAKNPTVNLHELDKVRSDAKRNGKRVGALCIKNKSGRGVIVLDLRDVAELSWRERHLDKSG